MYVCICRHAYAYERQSMETAGVLVRALCVYFELNTSIKRKLIADYSKPVSDLQSNGIANRSLNDGTNINYRK